MLKTAQWTHITTEDVGEGEKQEFEYNTPLPFNISGRGGGEEEVEESVVVPQPAEYDYVSYVAEYQNYMANSATLLEGQAKSHAEGSSSSPSALDPDYKSPHSELIRCPQSYGVHSIVFSFQLNQSFWLCLY